MGRCQGQNSAPSHARWWWCTCSLAPRLQVCGPFSPVRHAHAEEGAAVGMGLEEPGGVDPCWTALVTSGEKQVPGLHCAPPRPPPGSASAGWDPQGKTHSQTLTWKLLLGATEMAQGDGAHTWHAQGPEFDPWHPGTRSEPWTPGALLSMSLVKVFSFFCAAKDLEQRRNWFRPPVPKGKSWPFSP